MGAAPRPPTLRITNINKRDLKAGVSTCSIFLVVPKSKLKQHSFIPCIGSAAALMRAVDLAPPLLVNGVGTGGHTAKLPLGEGNAGLVMDGGHKRG